MKWMAMLLLASLTACSNLKPVEDRTRRFVLMEQRCAHSNYEIGRPIGIGRVEIPEYLRSKAIAQRVQEVEIKISDLYFWAESVDSAIQRVVARDMGLTNVYLDAWKRDAVALEIHLAIEQFDLDETGKATLRARYRITNAGGSETLHWEMVEFSREGPPLAKNPPLAVQSMSAAIADLSCLLLERCAELSKIKGDRD